MISLAQKTTEQSPGGLLHGDKDSNNICVSEQKASLMDMISLSDEMSDGNMDKTTLRWDKMWNLWFNVL